MAKTAFVTPNDNSGTTVSFAGQEYKCTDLTWSKTDITATDEIDTSTLDQAAGETVNTQPRPLVGNTGGDTGWSLTFNYFGNTPIEDGSSGPVVVSGNVQITGNGTCTDSSITATRNEVITGSATIRLDRPDTQALKATLKKTDDGSKK